MSKKALTKDIKTALQMLLDSEHVTPEGQTQTGAEAIALALYQQAADPESRNWSKAIDIVMKLTGERETLETDVLRYKLIKQTEPPSMEMFNAFGDSDGGTIQLRENIRERILSSL